MIVWRFTMNLVVVVADGNLFDACLIAASAAISKGQFSTNLTPVE
jgi:exosome complex RNA-binding protein Rrp42 (RNase PH superfamily)